MTKREWLNFEFYTGSFYKVLSEIRVYVYMKTGSLEQPPSAGNVISFVSQVCSFKSSINTRTELYCMLTSEMNLVGVQLAVNDLAHFLFAGHAQSSNH